MATAIKTNEDVKKNIIDHLNWDARIKDSHISVEVSGGEVTLKGSVPNYIAYQAAEEDAWTISDVKYVRNKLTIKHPPGVKIPPDTEIKLNIENILTGQPDIDPAEINAFVENGQVTLKGTVSAYWKKVRIEELILGLIGVIGIIDELVVVPTEKNEDKVIADNLTAALERSVETDLNLIDIQVDDGKVTLTGSVSSLPAFRAVETIAENTLGVLMVDNQLAIR